MANNTSSATAVNAGVGLSSAASEEGIQLRFPTIDLATSLESILTPSSNASTIMPRSNEPVEALDESWASLDNSDYHHGEDLQSEHTDAESLVDLSSNQDTESVLDDDDRDEHEIEEPLQETAADEPVDKSMKITPLTRQQQKMQFEDITDETIILQPSSQQQSSSWSQLEYTCDMPPISVSSTGLRETIEKQTLHMKVSKQHLLPMNKPFHIAYYGVGPARVSRDELLGKIGAALVASAPYQGTSKCYNIFPTEFGPGSKPAFAELIPSQAQMIVDDITVLRHGPDRPDTIRFALKQGMILESNTAVPTAGKGRAPWQPSLLVVHLCRDDLADDFYTAKQVIELAQRHYWPLLVVSQDSAAGLYPPCSRDLNKEFVTETADCSDLAEHPVDLDTFLRFDTGQLNRHIRFVIDAAVSRSQLLDSSSNFIDRVRVIASRIYGFSIGSNAQANGYVLKMIQASSRPEIKQPNLKTYKAKALRFFANPDHRRSLQDLAASLAITAVVLLIFTMYQSLSLNSYQVFGTSNGISLRHSVEPVTTVTATSAISTYVQSPTTTVHENSVSKGLDQMLQRLMGKAEIDETLSAKEMSQGRPQQKPESSEVETKILHHNTTDKASDLLKEVVFRISVKLDAAHKRWNETSAKRKIRQEENRERRRQKLKDLQDRLQEVSGDMSDRGQELYQQSLETFAKLLVQQQKKLAELIDRSQAMVKMSHRSSAKRMDELVKDQKTLLRRAQRQAQKVAERTKDSGKHEMVAEDVKHSKLRKAIRGFVPFV